MSVYFIECGRYIKIGFSQDPERRCARLFASATRYGAPRDVPMDLASRRLVKVIDGSKNTEALIHDALGDWCVSGEWYIDDAELRAFVDTVETAPAYKRAVRSAGNYRWVDDPILAPSPLDMADLDAKLSAALAGLFTSSPAP